MDAGESRGLSTAPHAHANDSSWSRPQTPPPETIASVRPSPPTHKPRRRHKLEQLRAQVQWMQHIAIALPLQADADEIWDEFLDRDTKRSRSLLRQLAAVIEDHKTLRRTHEELKMLLAEHSLAARTVRALLNQTTGQLVDGWDLDVQRWKALARIHYKPWTSEQCTEELDRAFQDRQRFDRDADKYTSGLQFMGWHDSLRVLRDSSALQFRFYKRFYGHNLQRHVESISRIYRETTLYSKVILGDHARASVDILQELTPHLAIVMYHERYDGSEHTVHALNLIATVESDDCVVHYMRSIHVPDVQRAFESGSDVWVSKFYWMQYDLLDRRQSREACDYRSSLRGTLEVHDARYLQLWLFELLAALVRWETMATGRSMLAG